MKYIRETSFGLFRDIRLSGAKLKKDCGEFFWIRFFNYGKCIIKMEYLSYGEYSIKEKLIQILRILGFKQFCFCYASNYSTVLFAFYLNYKPEIKTITNKTGMQFDVIWNFIYHFAYPCLTMIHDKRPIDYENFIKLLPTYQLTINKLSIKRVCG